MPCQWKEEPCVFASRDSKIMHFCTKVDSWLSWLSILTHWGRVTHICVSKQTIIGSDNGLSPGRRRANIWTNAGILLIGPLGTNFSEISIEIFTFSFKKMGLNVSSAKWWPFFLGLNVFMLWLNQKPAILKPWRQYLINIIACRAGNTMVSLFLPVNLSNL